MLDAERRLHAELGPSGAPRWTRCAGSSNAERGREDRPSIYAAHGTVYHEVIAECLTAGFEPDDYLARTFIVDGHVIVFDEVFAAPMRNAIDRVHERAAGGELFIETRVDISEFTLPGQFGTTDIGIIRKAIREIVIQDHKFGEGVPVNAVENEQLILYALGFWQDVARFAFDFDPKDVTVRLIIDQPRIAHAATPDPDDEEEDDGEEWAAEWVTTMGHLLERGAWFRERAQATLDPDAPRTAGVKQCLFCKARNDCAVLAKFNLDLYGMKFEQMNEKIEEGVIMEEHPKPDTLTFEQQVFIAEHRFFFRNWMNDVYNTVLDTVTREGPAGGMKAVRGKRGPRAWADALRVQKKLPRLVGMKNAYERKLISPTAAEKLMGKKEMAAKLGSLVTQSEGKLTLVRANDPREAVLPAKDRFENLEDDLI